MFHVKEYTDIRTNNDIINKQQPVSKNNFSTDLFIHSVNVGLLSKYIAKNLGLSNEQVYLVYNLGILHDVGKSEIPSNILYKKGKLTEREWDIMKNHPVYSEEFIKNHNVEYCHLLKYSNIVKFHHEHWDGSGYPEGLSNEDIPLLSRIITIADIYDAITTPRIYRETINVHPISTMEMESGTILDPYLFKNVRDLLQAYH